MNKSIKGILFTTEIHFMKIKLFLLSTLFSVKHIILSLFYSSLKTRYFARQTAGILNTFFWFHSQVTLASYIISHLLNLTGMDKPVSLCDCDGTRKCSHSSMTL